MKESDVQRAILDWLAAKRIFALRMQVGAMVSEYQGKKRFMRFGVPGCADILAFQNEPRYDVDNDEEVPDITPTWIECKAPKGRQSDLQKSFQAQVEAEGHQYILAYSLDDVIAALSE